MTIKKSAQHTSYFLEMSRSRMIKVLYPHVNKLLIGYKKLFIS